MLTVRRTYALWLLALLLKLVGSSWDVAYHFRYPFDVLSPAHVTNAAGLVLAFGLALHNLGALQAGRDAPLDEGSLRLVLTGLAVFLVAVPLDQLWHLVYGVDLTTWSPTHLALFAGTALVVFGVLLGLARRPERGPFRTLALLALSAFLLEAVLFACGQQEFGAVSVYVLHHPAEAAADGLVGPSAALLDAARSHGGPDALALGGVPPWLYPLFELAAAAFVLRIARRAVPRNGTATAVACLYVAYRAGARLVFARVGLPVSFVPYDLVAVGIAMDVAARAPAVAAAGAAAALYGGVAALRLVEIGPPTPIGTASSAFLDGGLPVGIALAWLGIRAGDAVWLRLERSTGRAARAERAAAVPL